LTPTIALWTFRNPSELQLPMWEYLWECEGLFLHTFLHSCEHAAWFLSFPLGLQPLALVTNPKLKLRHDFKIYPILFILHSYFERYINKGCDHPISHLKNLCTWYELIKRLNPKQKSNLCRIQKYLLSQPIYLFS